VNKLYIIILLLGVLFSCKKDESTLLTPTDTFVKYYGGSFDNDASQIVETTDGGFILAGKTENGSGHNSMLVIKVAANGNEEWSKTFSNENNEEAKSIIPGINGGFLIASNQTDTEGNQAIFLTQIGSTGAINWRKNYFLNDSTVVEKVIATTNNEYLMISNTTKYNATNSNPSGKSDFVLIKVNADGDFIASNQWGGVDDDFAYDLIENSSINSFIVVGATTSFQPPPLDGKSVLIAEFGTPLNLKKKATHGGASDDVANNIKLVADGYIICGKSKSNGNGGNDVYLLKTSTNIFNSYFEKHIGGAGNDIAHAIKVTANGNYLIAGRTGSFGNGNDAANDGYLIKIDANGNEIFQQTYGNSGDENIIDVLHLSDGKILLLGVSEVGGNQQISLTKTKEDGMLN
jgi:hypothetical protein